jgi:hypothetical protein
MALQRLERAALIATLLSCLTLLSACGSDWPQGSKCGAIALGADATALAPVISTQADPVTCGSTPSSSQCVAVGSRYTFIAQSADFACCTTSAGLNTSCAVDCSQFASAISRADLGGAFVGEWCTRANKTQSCAVFMRDGKVEAVQAHCPTDGDWN